MRGGNGSQCRENLTCWEVWCVKGEEAFLWEGGEGKISQAERMEGICRVPGLGEVWQMWGTKGSLLAGADCGGLVSAVWRSPREKSWGVLTSYHKQCKPKMCFRQEGRWRDWYPPPGFQKRLGNLPLCLSLQPSGSPVSPEMRKARKLQNGKFAPVTALLLGSSQISCKNLPWRQQDVNAGDVEL